MPYMSYQFYHSLLDNLPGKMDQLELSQQQQQGGTALSTSKSLTSFGEETFATDSDMNRQDIASGGVAPIVARESVFKYHMSKKDQSSYTPQKWTDKICLWGPDSKCAGES